jgi:hypothetical protein
MKKLAIAVALATILAACGGGDSSSADKKTTTTSTTASSSTTASTTTTAPAGPRVKDAAGTVRAWLRAVADGDDATAVAMLSQRSLAKIGGADGYQKMKLELAEGWGAWGRAEGIELTARTLPFPKDVAVVVLHGNVSQEGPPRESWNALPVVATPDGDRVEAFLDFGAITSDPAEGGKLASGDVIKITTATSSDTYFILDTGDAAMPALQDVNESGATWTYAPESLDAGLHSLTVVVAGDGIQVRRFEYTVD